MKKLTAATIVLAGLLGAGLVTAQEGPARPQPQKEHQWLDQLVGEWTVEGEATMDPAQPPVRFKGTDTGRRIGGFWATCEYKGELMGAPFTGVFTVGFDPDKKQFIGTWIDNTQAHLWQYKGALDATGKILTLETEGPCCEQPGKTVKVRDIIEIKSKDHRVFTMMAEKDGKWVTGMTLHYRRKA